MSADALPPNLSVSAESLRKVGAAAATIRNRWPARPRVGIILGTGLGEFTRAISVEAEIPCTEIPHFPPATALGHAGRLVAGRLGSVPVVLMQGRCHAYEGYSLEEITLPVRVLHQLGVRVLVVSCAAGGLASRLRSGDLMAIDDHASLLFRPLPIVNRRRQIPGPVYDQRLTERLLDLALGQNLPMARGTYVAVTGPNYETRAELRLLQRIADAVGMSTVPEASVAHGLGMRVCGIATITNLCNPDRPVVADGQHVIDVASHAQPRFRSLVCEFVRGLEFERIEAAPGPPG